MAAMSGRHSLLFCGSAHAKNILHVNPSSVVDSHLGQMVQTVEGIFVSARLPQSSRLPSQKIAELEQLARHGSHRAK